MLLQVAVTTLVEVMQKELEGDRIMAAVGGDTRMATEQLITFHLHKLSILAPQVDVDKFRSHVEFGVLLSVDPYVCKG